jgi:fructose-1-phosphate kinase PfkB-like protein
MRGVRTLIDADGEALAHALEAKPTLITPNQQEAERLLGRAILTRSQFMEACTQIHAMGPEAAILSLGSRGALACSKEGMFEAVPPRIEAVCPIGAGDALAAAFVWAVEKKKSFSDALRWGVAAGTATASLPGMSFPSLEEIRTIYKRVEVHEVR